MSFWVYCSVAVAHIFFRALKLTKSGRSGSSNASTRFSDLPELFKRLVKADYEWMTTEIMSWEAEEEIFLLQV
jgi:hypothetical protein